MTVEIGEANFLEEVIESDIPAVVDFSASWCLPCQPMSNLMDKLSEGYQGKVKFFKLDVDQNTELADKLNIKSVPTLLLFNSQGKVGALVGLAAEEKVKAKIEELLIGG